MNKVKAIETEARNKLKEFVVYQIKLLNNAFKHQETLLYQPQKTEGTWVKKIVVNQKGDITFFDGLNRPSDWEDIEWEELFNIATWLEETFHDECKTRQKDFVVICDTGLPLTFTGETDVVVYGDKEEAKADMENEDLGIITLEYEKANPNCAIIKDFNDKEIGNISFDGTNESDFQKKLYDFIVVYDFLSHSLPH